MPESRSTNRSMSGGRRSLAQRVEDRVSRAAQARRRRHGAARPRIRPAKRPTDAAHAAHDGEAKALRDVFVDLGERYRAYRRRTGTPISPVIRSAACAFRAEPSLLALIPVAGHLDDLSLLDW